MINQFIKIPLQVSCYVDLLPLVPYLLILPIWPGLYEFFYSHFHFAYFCLTCSWILCYSSIACSNCYTEVAISPVTVSIKLICLADIKLTCTTALQSAYHCWVNYCYLHSCYVNFTLSTQLSCEQVHIYLAVG